MSEREAPSCAAASSARQGSRRILLLSRGGALDGEQRQLCHLAANLDRRRFVPLVVLDEEGPCAAELRRGGVELAILPTRDWRRFPEMLWRYMDGGRVLRRARAWGVDLVHASDRWKSHYALLIARRMGIPCVMHARGPMSSHDAAKHGYRKASAVIAISKRYQQDLLGLGLAAERVQVVDDAVDQRLLYSDPAGRERVRQEWGIGQRVALGLVGRLEPFKKTIEFLEAVGHVPPAAQAVWLVIGQPGPAEYMRRVERVMARMGLQNRVHFAGRRDDMRQVLSALDVLVTLSGGSVMFEAMACGTTVMTVRDDDRPAVHARHDETAWCLTTRDPRAVAGNMERLITDGALRRRLGDAGRAWTGSHLSIAALVAGTEAAYTQVLGG